MIRFEQLTLAYEGAAPLLHCASGRVPRGSLVCLVGGNGVGKSTLLRVLAGLSRPTSGWVQLNGRDIGALAIAERAQQIGLVLTDDVANTPLSVCEMVGLGRIPYVGWTGRLRDTDETAVEDAIQQLNLHAFRDRTVATLSDGERQRVAVARALAQQTPCLLMDEPLSHLDLPGKLQLMSLFATLAHRDGKTVFLTTHEIEIAKTFADELWLFPAGGPLLYGAPEEHILSGDINQLFTDRGVCFDDTLGRFVQPPPELIGKVRLSAAGRSEVWTRVALARVGINVDPEAAHEVAVHRDAGHPPTWLLSGPSHRVESQSLVEFLANLREIAGDPLY